MSSIYQIFPHSKSLMEATDCNKTIDWINIKKQYDGIIFGDMFCQNSSSNKPTRNIGYLWRLGKNKFVKII